METMNNVGRNYVSFYLIKLWFHGNFMTRNMISWA